MKRIVTERPIAAPPERVWAVLCDFRRYAEWNPLNILADGEARAGARVRMRFVDAGSRKRRVIEQTVTVTLCDPPHRLSWVGRIPLLFRGQHWFELNPAPGGTLLRHGEMLSGLVPLAFGSERLERQRRAYEAMNEALAERVARLSRGSRSEPRRRGSSAIAAGAERR